MSKPAPFAGWFGTLLEEIGPEDIEPLRRLILGAADRVCTKKQRAAVALFLDGKNITQIAKTIGVSRPTAHHHLFGHHHHGGGALTKLQDAILEDAALIQEITTMVEKQKKALTPQQIVTSWFSRLTPAQTNLFGPLVVLLVAEFVVDSKRSAMVSDLYLYLPRKAVNMAIAPLRATGYITSDGVRFTIRKTPIDDLRREAA
jgi:hypothetical protein